MKSSNLFLAMAVLAGMAHRAVDPVLGIPRVLFPQKARKAGPKKYPQPPCSAPEVIAAHNEAVKTRQVLRRRYGHNWRAYA